MLLWPKGNRLIKYSSIQTVLDRGAVDSCWEGLTDAWDRLSRIVLPIDCCKTLSSTSG